MTLKIRARITGTQRLKATLKKYGDNTGRALPAALYQEAEKIMTQAKKLTPVDTGTLRSSGHVVMPKENTRRVLVELGFGGPAGSGNQGQTNTEGVGYAVKVHEDMQAYHRVGQAKYLEEPLSAAQRNLISNLIRRIKRNRGPIR